MSDLIRTGWTGPGGASDDTSQFGASLGSRPLVSSGLVKRAHVTIGLFLHCWLCIKVRGFPPSPTSSARAVRVSVTVLDMTSFQHPIFFPSTTYA